MITLKEVNNFNNFSSQAVFFDIERTIVSPLGTFLLRYSQKQNINLFNLSSYSQIPFKAYLNNTKILRAVFSLDEQYIFFTNQSALLAYSMVNQTISSIIPHNITNRITDYKFNSNFNILYYLNQSQLYSFNYTARLPMFKATKLSKPSCVPDKFVYDQKTSLIITSSVSTNTCIVCKWKVEENKFTFMDTQIFNAGCLLNDLYIFGDQLAITKKNFNSAIFGNTIVVNLTSLNTIMFTNETNEGTNRAGFIAPYHNYYLQYFSQSNHIFFYKDSLANDYFNISYQFVKSVAFNPVKQEFYIFSKTNMSLDVMRALKPFFNCQLVNGSLTQSLQTDCMCANGSLFNKQSFACQKPHCFDQQNKCSCLKGQIFNNFNLKCELKCSNVANALPVQAQGSPEKCYCYPQFSWDDKEMGCYSLSNKQVRGEASSPAGVIIVVIIIILLLFAAALLYYYKKCKNQADPKQQQQDKGNQGIESDRPMSEKPKTNPSLDSNEHLKSREQKIDEPHQVPKEFIHNTQPEDIQNFSIDEDEGEKQNYFSEIESNIQHPLR